MESDSWAQHVLTESLALNELGHGGGGSRNGKRELGTACTNGESRS